MSRRTALKKKFWNPNKGQSPVKNTSIDVEFQSISELAKLYQTVGEKLANEHNDKAVKDQAPLAHKRKHPILALLNAREGRSSQRLIELDESIPKQRKSKLTKHNSVAQSSSAEDLNTSQMIGRTLNEVEAVKDQTLLPYKRKSPVFVTLGASQGQNMLRSIQFEESIQIQGKGKLPTHKSVLQSSSRKNLNAIEIIQDVVEKQFGNQELSGNKMKRKLILPSSTLTQFLEAQGIHIGSEEQLDVQLVDDVRCTPSLSVDRNNVMDDVVSHEEVDEYECNRNEAMDIYGDRGRMSREAALRKMVLNPNKGQLTKEAVNDQTLLTYKRKSPRLVALGARQGQMQGKGKLPMHKSVGQSSSRKNLNALERTQDVGEKQVGIQELRSGKKMKRKTVLPPLSLNYFLEEQGMPVGYEEQLDAQPVDEVRSTPTLSVDRNNIVDDDIAHDEVGEDECDINDAMDNGGNRGGTSKKRKVRGRTRCSAIHARKFEEREEVTFDKGQAVGPTDKRVSDLSFFLGTIARNPEFVTLLYTSWHAVPKDTKEHMWEYVNSKFIIPPEGKKWVMDCLRDAWRRHKRCIKKKHFEGYDSIDDMLENRPTDIPENQFRQLIQYWKLPAVQAMCHVNSRNRKKQKCGHRMGPVNFGRVRMALRATKENNEEPSQFEMFIATRARKGKEVDRETQIAISELENRQNLGESAEDAFKAVFGNEKPGAVRCYGRSVTPSSLKVDEEINKLKRKHADEVTSLRKEVQELRVVVKEVQELREVVKEVEELRKEVKDVPELRQEVQELKQLWQFLNVLVQNNPGLILPDVGGYAGSDVSSSVDTSAQAVGGQSGAQSSGSDDDSY